GGGGGVWWGGNKQVASMLVDKGGIGAELPGELDQAGEESWALGYKLR
ncbi:hypothetical protein HKBW3S42_01601, partial [Candidatus Hakubella thermalkaliphila]